MARRAERETGKIDIFGKMGYDRGERFPFPPTRSVSRGSEIPLPSPFRTTRRAPSAGCHCGLSLFGDVSGSARPCRRRNAAGGLDRDNGKRHRRGPRRSSFASRSHRVGTGGGQGHIRVGSFGENHHPFRKRAFAFGQPDDRRLGPEKGDHDRREQSEPPLLDCRRSRSFSGKPADQRGKRKRFRRRNSKCRYSDPDRLRGRQQQRGAGGRHRKLRFADPPQLHRCGEQRRSLRRGNLRICRFDHGQEFHCRRKQSGFRRKRSPKRRGSNGFGFLFTLLFYRLDRVGSPGRV